jgi:hypothetical protein
MKTIKTNNSNVKNLNGVIIMTNKNQLNSFDEAAIETCSLVIKDLIKNFEVYKLNTEHLTTLTKALYALQNYPEIKIDGSIDISASTRWDGGGLDYSTFTVAGDYLEISAGGITYNCGIANESYSEEIYLSGLSERRDNLPAALKCWLDSFYLHIKDSGPKAIYINDMAEASDADRVFYSTVS